MVILNTNKKCLQMGAHVMSMKKRKLESGYIKSQNRQLEKTDLFPFDFCLTQKLLDHCTMWPPQWQGGSSLPSLSPQ